MAGPPLAGIRKDPGSCRLAAKVGNRLCSFCRHYLVRSDFELVRIGSIAL